MVRIMYWTYIILVADDTLLVCWHAVHLDVGYHVVYK